MEIYVIGNTSQKQCLQNVKHKMYWDQSIIMDSSVTHNGLAILPTDKAEATFIHTDENIFFKKLLKKGLKWVELADGIEDILEKYHKSDGK